MVERLDGGKAWKRVVVTVELSAALMVVTKVGG